MSLSISPAISPLFCQSIAGVLTVNLRAADLDPGLETLGLREVSMVCSSFDAKHPVLEGTGVGLVAPHDQFVQAGLTDHMTHH